MGQTIYWMKSNVKNLGALQDISSNSLSSFVALGRPALSTSGPFTKLPNRRRRGIELRHSGGLPLRPAIQRPAAGVLSGGGGKTYSRRLVGKDIYARTSGRRGLCAAAGERRHP